MLTAGLLELGADPARLGSRLEQLESLALLLVRWGQRINLTAHRTPEAIARRLILDALALAGALPELPSLADLGSGAGFPGLPIAIRHPRCRVTLVEARERRHHFQRAAVRVLGLGNVTLVHGRAEALEPTRHAAAVAQAVARPDQALDWMLPWVEPGGLLVLPGAQEAGARLR